MGESLSRDFILALDLGGTQFRLALANRDGKLLSRYAASTHAAESQRRLIERINKAIREITSDIGLEQVLGMGVAAAGLVNPGTGVLLSSPNLPKLRNVPLKALLEWEIEAPVWLANDASLAALGEHRFGAGRGFSHLIYITVSTGIGGGVIIDNGLFLGSQGYAAEIGHMVIDPDGPRCACGNTGCLEALASGSAIARMASEELSRGRVSSITSLAGDDLGHVTAEMVARAAQSGDPLALEIMERAGASLGIGVVNLLHLFDPELVIIGGGVSRAGELILAPVRRVIAERAMSGFRGAKVVTSALGDDSGLLGAVTWVLDNIVSTS
jgi:glucokinase